MKLLTKRQLILYNMFFTLSVSVSGELFTKGNK